MPPPQFGNNFVTKCGVNIKLNKLSLSFFYLHVQVTTLNKELTHYLQSKYFYNSQFITSPKKRDTNVFA